MTLNAQSTHPSSGPDAKRNFILQQGLCEPEAGTCPLLYSALLFQPWLVGSWVVVAAVLQAPLLFFALAAVSGGAHWLRASILSMRSTIGPWRAQAVLPLPRRPRPAGLPSFWPDRSRLRLGFHSLWVGGWPPLSSRASS